MYVITQNHYEPAPGPENGRAGWKDRAMSATDCIFCKIVRGEVPSAKVIETDTVFAFLDIAPVAPGHTLVIPKAHYATILEIPQGLAPDILAAIQKLAPAVMRATGSEGFNLNVNTHEAAGQIVPHAHWHIIPRSRGDGLKLWAQKPYTDNESMNSIARAIRDNLTK